MLPLPAYEALRSPPQGSPRMFQRWRSLLFLHSRHDPAEIQKLLPAGLEVDTFDGSAWVGLVPFRMEGVRFRGAPALPGLSAFPETNVRTYAHKDGVPGVWFFSLDAANALACATARKFYGLPYHFAAMRVLEDEQLVRYRHERKGAPGIASRIDCRIGQELSEPRPGSLEFFLIERYLLFSQKDGHLRTGRVFHRPYALRTAQIEGIEESLVKASGIAPRDFEHVVFSPGVDVRVFGLAGA